MNIRRQSERIETRSFPLHEIERSEAHGVTSKIIVYRIKPDPVPQPTLTPSQYYRRNERTMRFTRI